VELTGLRDHRGDELAASGDGWDGSVARGAGGGLELAAAAPSLAVACARPAWRSLTAAPSPRAAGLVRIGASWSATLSTASAAPVVSIAAVLAVSTRCCSCGSIAGGAPGWLVGAVLVGGGVQRESWPAALERTTASDRWRAA